MDLTRSDIDAMWARITAWSSLPDPSIGVFEVSPVINGLKDAVEKYQTGPGTYGTFVYRKDVEAGDAKPKS